MNYLIASILLIHLIVTNNSMNSLNHLILDQDEQGEYNASKWGIVSWPGHSSKHEDKYGANVMYTIEGDPILYSAFDGHGGDLVASRGILEMHRWISSEISFSMGDTNWGNKILTGNQTEIIKKAIINGIIKLDQAIYADQWYGGSTFVGVLQTKSHYFVINLGDSQCRIYSSKTKQIIYKSKLHSVSKANDKPRILSSGGKIGPARRKPGFDQATLAADGIDMTFYVIHSNPELRDRRSYCSVSRALGDNLFKVSRVIEGQPIYGGDSNSAILAIADVDIISKYDYPNDVYGDLYAFLFSDGIGDMIELAEEYPNVTSLPQYWKMNLMDMKPINQTEYAMQTWARLIVGKMSNTDYRKQHDNMGILIAKLT